MIYERMEKEAAEADEPEVEARQRELAEEEALLKVSDPDTAPSACPLRIKTLAAYVCGEPASGMLSFGALLPSCGARSGAQRQGLQKLIRHC